MDSQNNTEDDINTVYIIKDNNPKFSQMFVNYNREIDLKSWKSWLIDPLQNGLRFGVFQSITNNGFGNGLIFGTLSGFLTIGTTPLFNLTRRQIDNNISDIETNQIAHIINYSASIITPWVCSYFIMSKYLPQGLVSPKMAIFLTGFHLIGEYSIRKFLERT